MSVKSDILRVLKAYAHRQKNPMVEFETFRSFLEKYLPRHEEELKDLADQQLGLADTLAAGLMELENEGKCSLKIAAGRPHLIIYTGYYRERLEAEYTRLSDRPELPFPSEESLNLNIPPEQITSADIKTDFIALLEKTEQDPPELIKVLFPDGIRSILLDTQIVGRLLLAACFHKMRGYLRNPKNTAYMQQKMMGIFRGREPALRDMFRNILTRPDQALSEFEKPSDFSFHFWAQMSSFIVKEFAQKKDKLDEEHGFCQAAYIMGFFTVYKKGKLQKEKEVENSTKLLEQAFRNPPFAFTLNDIHAFKDGQGILLTKKLELPKIHRFIEEKTSTTTGEGKLPEIIRLKTSAGGEYYIRKENVCRILAERLFSLGDEYREYFVDRWHGLLADEEKETAMSDDEAFEAAVEARFREREPLLSTLLNFNLLFLLKDELALAPIELDTLNRLLDIKRKAFIPMARFLELSRKDLFANAKLLLPFWQVIPVLNVVFKWINNLLVSRSKGPKREKAAPAAAGAGGRRPDGNGSSGRGGRPAVRPAAAPSKAAGSTSMSLGGKPPATARARQAQFREAVEELKKNFIDSPAGLKKELKDKIAEWNPLIDEAANRNLVEDVNSLVRDCLRRLKIKARLVAPDAERLRNIARELAANEVLGQIKRKDALRRYIELYMLDLLSKV